MIEVGPKVPEDDLWLLAMSQQHFAESNYSDRLTWSPVECMRILREGIWHVAKDEGKIIGYTWVILGRFASVELVGDLVFWYVIPEKRGTEAGRMLLKNAVEGAAEAGCARIYSSASGGMTPMMNKLQANAFAKAGFSELGVYVYKDLQWDQ